MTMIEEKRNLCQLQLRHLCSRVLLHNIRQVTKCSEWKSLPICIKLDLINSDLDALRLLTISIEDNNEELKSVCEHWFRSTLTVSNVCTRLLMLSEHDAMLQLKRTYLHYICQHSSEVFASDDWRQHTPEHRMAVMEWLIGFLLETNRHNRIVG